ncbi:MAG: DNA polymerase III subunit chi [Gammaproteobacteria bacterium]|jgi:DNA polymerase-3 subunit chi|nr:DNA polymerase III subunit chi [Gammaproteobacteria bacterium]
MSPPRVSFYVLDGAEPGARLGYACRLVEKVYKLNQRIHAHVADGGMARQLDELLWTFRQGSFVPHEVLAAGQSPQAPVTIGADGEPPAADLLINLAPDVPSFYSRFARVAEIIDDTPGCREAGRARHRFYRQQGLEPETHREGN